MSYHHRNRYGRRPRAPQGVLGALGSIASTIGTGLDIATDPYLPEVVCRASQLHAIEVHQPVPECQSLPDGMQGGIGLRKVMSPLRAFVYAEENKWVYPVAVFAIIGLPFLLGYEMGKD